MFHPEIPLWNIAVRTVIVYGAVLVGLRLAGKREIGQMTAFDLVVILLIANGVQTAMVGPNNSVTGGLVAAGTLIALNALVAFLRERISWLRRAVEGSPTLLVNDGRVIDGNLRRENIGVDEVLMALREHGIDDPANVRAAILETDGSISVVAKDNADGVVGKPRRRIRQRPHN